MTDQSPADSRSEVSFLLDLPDLPTAVGMPGSSLEVEVGGHICLLSSAFEVPNRA